MFLKILQVTLNSLIFSFSAFISSYWSGVAAGKYGKTAVLLVGTAIDFSTFLTCLFWMPTENTVWIIYILFFIEGISDGCWQVSVASKHYFIKTIFCKTCGFTQKFDKLV